MRHLPLRPAIVVFASLCVWTVFTPASHGQQTSGPALPFPASAWRAIAHGKPAEAEALAQARPTNDPAAIAVLAHLDIARGRFAEALSKLQPAANRAPLTDATLELGLLFQKLGRVEEASPLLTVIFRASGDDPVSLTRAARAAAAPEAQARPPTQR